jgi:metal-responsive CopG/Arc/MetJ family transcriptional regulator
MSEPKKYRTHKAKMRRVTISINDGLLDMIDKAAEKDFTTRSDIIRMAVLWYLRPQGRDLAEVDTDTILKTLQHRKARAGVKKMMDELGF